MTDVPPAMLAFAVLAALVVAIVGLNIWYRSDRRRMKAVKTGINTEKNALDLNTW